MYDTRPGCRSRPEKESPGDDPVDVQAVYKPAGYGLQTCIGPEERREKNTQLRCRNAKLILNHGSGDGEIATIHIVDEDGDSQQNENCRQLGRESFALRWLAGCHKRA